MADQLYVDRLGSVSGPYTRQELMAMAAAGTLQPGHRLSDGGSWRRADRLLGFPSQPRMLHWVLWGAFLSCWAVLAWLQYFEVLLPSRWVERALVAGMIIVGAAAGLLPAIFLKGRMQPNQAVLMTALFGLTAAGLLVQALALNRAFDAADAHENHELVRVQPGYYRLSGHLGRHLAADLASVLSDERGTLLLEIDSPGGNPTGALAAADFLRRRGDVVVRIKGVCASACVPLLVASPIREMHYSARIGVHQSSSLLGEELQATVDMRPYLAALRAGGLGAEVLRAAEQTPPEEIAHFSPVADREQFPPLHLVDDNGKRIRLAYAAALRISDFVGNLNLPRGEALLEMVELTESAMPEVFDAHTEALAVANRFDGDKALGAVLLKVFERAMSMADPSTVALVLASSIRTAEIQLAESTESDCSKAPNETIDDALFARLELLRAAAANGWQRVEPASEAILDAVRRDMARNPVAGPLMRSGIANASARERCAFELEFMRILHRQYASLSPAIFAAVKNSP